MGLIKCIDCGKEFSDRIDLCPNCLCQKEENEVVKQINSYENIYLMLESGIDFVRNNYKKFLDINYEINSTGISKFINFSEVNEKIVLLLEDSRKKLIFLQDGFDLLKEFPKKDIYLAYRKTLSSYIKLLELDFNINHKLNDKSKGGKYSFFEYKKDSKKRNELCKETVQLVEHLSNIFIIKKLSKNSYILIDTCEYLVYSLKEKYKNEIRNNSKKYKEFREELCSFFDHAIALPYDKDAESFRKGVLWTITDFIELIELKEEQNPDFNKINKQEDALFVDLDIIKEKIYEIRVYGDNMGKNIEITNNINNEEEYDPEKEYAFRNYIIEQIGEINITKNNLSTIDEKNVLFIETANDGTTYIMDNRKNLFFVELEYGKEITKEDFAKKFSMYAKTNVDNEKYYKAINLGMGHALLIKTDIYNDYMKLLKENIVYENEFEDCYTAYCHWMDCAIKFLKNSSI